MNRKVALARGRLGLNVRNIQPVFLSLVSLSVDFHSFAFLYLAFILSIYSYFFFLYHLSLLLPRSYFLSIGSPIHLCFIFLPVMVPITRLRYKFMPRLCFPCAFLPSGPAASHAPFPIFRHFCLCCAPLHFYLLCPIQALCLDIKNPLPGSLLQEGVRFSYGVLSIALGLLLFPYRSCYCSLYLLYTYRSYLLVLPDSPGSDFRPDLPAPCGLGSLSQNLNVSLIPSHF